MAETRCLFCSMQCPVSVEVTRGGRFLPRYGTLPDGTLHPLCGRGNLIAELASGRGRLSMPLIRQNGELSPLSLQEALGILSGWLSRKPASNALIIDGNLPEEDIKAGAAFASGVLDGAPAAVFLPPCDEQALDGLDASSCPLGSWARLGASDLFLAIGDVFCSHPVAARNILKALRESKENRLVVLDSRRSRTSAHAHSFFFAPPGALAVFLSALAEKFSSKLPEVRSAIGGLNLANLLEEASIPSGTVNALADLLSGARAPIFFLDVTMGREPDWEAVAAVTSLLARATGGSVIPLFTYGNARGAWQTRRRFNLASVSDFVSSFPSAIEVLLLVNCAFLSYFPDSYFSDLVSRAKKVVAISPLSPEKSLEISMALPSSWWFEETGLVSASTGESVSIAPVLSSPSGVESPRELLRLLSSLLGRASRLEEGAPEGGETPKASPGGFELKVLKKASPGKFRLVATSGPYNFAEGAVTRRCGWPELMEEPEISLNPEDARSRNWREGRLLRLSSPYDTVSLPLKLDARLPRGIASVSEHFVETRRLFGWKPQGNSGGIYSGPVDLEISSAEG